ncbi:MAG: NUDIX domain-containing protein [Caldilineaceae bacterium SB0665_bin_21]|nr:NUDIX domain-containing protein [Caldilineaceae bacterium SB0665_bin_21]
MATVSDRRQQENGLDATDKMSLVADELRNIADLGLHFAQDHYDKDRYGRVRSLSARLVAALAGKAAADVMQECREDVVHATPFVAAEAAVFREGHILLIKREDNGLWAMPGGATEVGETWAESVERELREETGVQGTATDLLGVFDSRLWRSRAKRQIYVGVWLVEIGDQQSPVAGPETTGVGFFAEDDLPDLSPGHKERVPAVFKLVRGDLSAPYFDPTNRSGSALASR